MESIPTVTISGKRDRALIGLMTYSFARIGAALSMEVRDVYVQNRRLWVVNGGVKTGHGAEQKSATAAPA